jgi:outer membrane protein insertion porin family
LIPSFAVAAPDEPISRAPSVPKRKAAPEAPLETSPAVRASISGTGSRLSEFEGKTVGTVDIRGMKRIEKDAVLAKVGTKPGQELSGEQIRADIVALFNMGFFNDIEVQGEPAGGGVNVIYSVQERPVISKVDFEGNERVSTSDLKDVIKVKEYSILDVNRVKEDVALIQKHYEDKGFYLAKVSFEVKPVKDDEVELVYRVNDYDKVEIKKITFLNNKHFSDGQLKEIFQETKEGSLLSFISGSGSFKESAFKQDLQRLTYWYLDKGYIKFKYENPVVTVSDDKRFLYISIYVDEGEVYSLGPTDFGGDLLFSKEELGNELTLKQGDVFSISKRNADIQRLTEKYQDLGYAFVNVIPRMNPKDDTKTVDVQYEFEKGNLVYFNEINILGNTKTHDKVIRRELKIHEGELYNGTNLRLSREAVERLGYFAPGEVIFNTVTPKGKNDVVNVEITVKERSTGTITLGAGYGSVQGFFFTGTVSEINFLGRGQTISLAAQYAATAESQSLNLGFTDPYAFDTLWSMGGDIFRVVFPVTNRYVTFKLGFDVRLGYPIFDYTYAYVTYKNEAIQIRDDKTSRPELGQLDSGILSSVVWSVVRDKRNNRFETTGGNYQSVSFETAGLGGDKSFLKLILNNRFYSRVVGDLVFRTSQEVGGMWGLGDRDLPPAEKFYLGGPNNMKGYQLFLLGPQYTESDRQTGQPFQVPLGGTFEAFALFELEYPLIREAGLKAVVFFDAGNCWDSAPGLSDLSIRTDVGFGIRWFSPIGPLRFEWGFPIQRKTTEQSVSFQFFIGPPF